MAKQRRAPNRTATRKAAAKPPVVAGEKSLPSLADQHRELRAVAFGRMGSDADMQRLVDFEFEHGLGWASSPGYGETASAPHGIPEADVPKAAPERRPRRVRRRVSKSAIPLALWPAAQRLKASQEAYELAATELAESVAFARSAGVSWRLLGEFTGMTPEGARSRWGRARQHRDEHPRPSA